MPKKKKPYANDFKFSLEYSGTVIDSTGPTALEALQALPRPQKITSKGLLTISQGDKKKTIDMNVQKLKRLFYPNSQPVLVKWLAADLK